MPGSKKNDPTQPAAEDILTEVEEVLQEVLPNAEQEGINLRKIAMQEDLNNPLTLVDRVFQIYKNWADFHLYIISPTIHLISPPKIILPSTKEPEFVYPIHDFGASLSTSKALDMYSAGGSMCKLYYTIEKMVHILIERLKSMDTPKDKEVQVAFAGHLLAQRKAFEVIINLEYNVVATNFNPGAWGDYYLQVVKNMVAKGLGSPSTSPRDNYKAHTAATAPKAGPSSSS